MRLDGKGTNLPNQKPASGEKKETSHLSPGSMDIRMFIKTVIGVSERSQ
ncbi:hypothetical protein Xmau_01921 [Xenorhabdus mauleonii]|uniref:Uncharacterized protein n=1 Tax=Xenorhabdus mauleonii TaxID=351675 RepID=A0A1I3I3G9_9GAMM|nr:hypothetical protein Xmau_01921 [Xenorhabdus mauleonii]SFI42419.1 hypothetical protein SAMN05421680_101176 [Xenorhabdus mauleonii]